MDPGATRIVVYGAGAIGATVGGWLAEAGADVTFVARGSRASILREQGLKLYEVDHRDAARTWRVSAVSDVSAAPEAPIIIVAVKNYDLEVAARDIREKLRGEPLIVALQNGVENQQVLPHYFSRIVYGVVHYNSWRDADNVFGYQTRGPIMLGVLHDDLAADRDRTVELFSRAFPCTAEPRIADAARCKMLFNLANSITTLVGFGIRPIEDWGALQRCVGSVLYEGMQILQAAGIREVRLARGGNWTTVRLMKWLPGAITTRLFRRKMENVQKTSMVQDVYVMKRGVTELESLNGYFVGLAESVGFDARCNKALYGITKEWLARPDIRPMHEAELWARLQAA